MKLGVEVHSALEQASRQVFQAHGRDVHFTGCGIGLRRRGGCVTGEPVVIAMVTKKLPAGAVSRSRLLPRAVRVDGRDWGVDVVEAGPLTLAARGGTAVRPQLDGPITGAFNPPLQGCSISDSGGPQNSTGTFGCLVRDTSDNTICVLGSNTVLAQNGLVPAKEPVVQPSVDDSLGIIGLPVEIATLKRYIPYTTAGTNFVDGAIAQLTAQKGYSQDVADSLMKPISATHPAVGVCVVSDTIGLNCFMSPMSSAVTALGVELLPATGSSSCIVAPEVGMKIEKVARTSGYTSSTVDAIGAQINVQDNDTGRTLVFGNMIWTQAFFIPGDSGAVACQGGNGRTFVPPPVLVCGVLDSVGHYYELPLTKDNALTSQIKTQFLAQSLVGNLIIGLIYINSETVIDRVKGKQATGIVLSYAQEFYDKYLPLVKSALADPGSATRVVTEGNLSDFQFILAGLSGAGGVTPVLTGDESSALQTIYTDVVAATKGLDYDQVVSYLNEVTVYEKVVTALASVPTIKLTGTIAADPLPGS